jgi:hypothetical protein
VASSSTPGGDHTFAIDDMVDVADKQEKRLAKKHRADNAVVDLRGEDLTCIPLSLWGTYEAAADLAVAQQLNVANNRIHCMPQEAFFTCLPGLRELNLSFNNLDKLPAALQLIPQLSILRVSNNKLKELCKELGSCTSLQMLELDNNNLTDLPPVVAELPNLTSLLLRSNSLRSLPLELGKAASLLELDVSCNMLTNMMPVEDVRGLLVCFYVVVWAQKSLFFLFCRCRGFNASERPATGSCRCP